MKVTLLYIILFCLTGQDNCLGYALIKGNYFTEGKYVKQGFPSGELNFYAEIDCSIKLKDTLVLTVYNLGRNGEKVLLAGAACNVITKDNKQINGYKIKGLLGVSDKKGHLLIPLSKKNITTISIGCLSYTTKVYDYTKLIECTYK
ncbi:hypothetical protein [Flavobacterium subsaxonicum]|uniref:Uncharacterized protein n=1 Tax=Flavobacterium subsaxonicum WB 4.1-42 = DSM 21790 TaxID=1121898 RepID=A0A0A2ME09_9FLAO|nr:hypothetical protein [Flavobacterium subsaxonicum]KGO90927.1 hypothetical protein Q766_20755 [Flavobacterium subsaxonicum WB 4.1-42 = DSM 21790]